ncbi:hypothetical protein [Mangrovicoccus ximenensis]|uniref:hypothetical protein n=1 Tax=Mangrovicoccus ximenensis TaxID=1911570 RepID=UPI000D398A36|nr:hypothetical protein [Mangrovicoccus ximenensis]
MLRSHLLLTAAVVSTGTCFTLPALADCVAADGNATCSGDLYNGRGVEYQRADGAGVRTAIVQDLTRDIETPQNPHAALVEWHGDDGGAGQAGGSSDHVTLEFVGGAHGVNGIAGRFLSGATTLSTACVQRSLELNPMLAAQERALARHAGEAAAAAVRAICGLPDAEVIRRLFAAAGFREISVDSVALELHHPDARAFARGAMGGMHTGDKLSGLGGADAEAAVETFLDGLGPCFDGTGMRFPHVSHVIEARA